MNLQFATCDRRRAFEFLQDLYPTCVVSDTNATAVLLDLVQADVLRVQDPAYHSPAQVVAGTHYDESMRDKVTLAAKAMHDEIMSTTEAEVQA